MTTITSYTVGDTTSIVLTVKGSLENMEKFLYTGVTDYDNFEMTEDTLKIQWVMERPVCVVTGERYSVKDLINKVSQENVDLQIFKETGMKTISFE